MLKQRVFDLENDTGDWLDASTGEYIERVATFTLSKNLISVENLYSREFDMIEAGFTGDERDAYTGHARTFGPRGEIKDFTRASQKRFMKSCALWEPMGQLIFVTLTYPRTWPEPEERMKHFKKFQAVLRKSRPNWAGCWKLEYQRRGAPHYHAVFETGLSHPDLADCQQFVQRVWDDCIETSGRTEVKFPRNPARAKYYLTKEVGKMVQTSKTFRDNCDVDIVHKGRFWGWHKRNSLTFSGNRFTVPTWVGLLIKEALQAQIVRGMDKDGKLIWKDGVPYFKNNDIAVEPDLLPAYRVYDNAHAAYNEIVDYVKEKHGVNVDDHKRGCSRPLSL